MTEAKTPLSNQEKVLQLAMLDRGIASQVKREKTDPSPIFPPQSETRKREKAAQELDNKEFINKLRVLLQGSSHPSIKNSMDEVSSRFRAFETAKYASDEELNRLPPDLQDLILTLADRIRSIRLTEQTGAQPISTNSLERSAPPLPTAEDMAKDPTKTWVGRDKGIRVLDKEGKLQPETPLDFFRRVYASWIGVITKADVRRIDPKLYEALDNWSRRTKTVIPSDILPTAWNHKKPVSITEEEKKIYSKISAIYNKRSRQRKRA